MDYDIFISYRRVGGAQYARILKAELEKRGYRDCVFLDYDELKDGRFDSRIKSAIESAPVFIFILSPGSLDRCKNEDDWVRQEIIHAIEHERHIIPVNFDGLFKEFPPTVPEQVREALGQHQFTKIDSETLLNASVEMLINDRIAPIITPRESASKQEVGAEIAILSDVDCDIRRFRKRLAVAHADTETFIRLVKGNHLLEFVSKEYPEIKDTRKYNVPDNDYSDFIEVNLKARVEEKRLESLRLIAVQDASGRWGYVDTSGNVVIPCIYDYAEPFMDGLARIKYASGRSSFIDKTDKDVIPLPYEPVMYVGDGLVCVKDNTGKNGCIDKTGKLVIPCIYKGIGRFNEGLAPVCDSNGKCGFIDKTGYIVIPCEYDGARSFNDGLAPVKRLGWGFIDKKGNNIIPCLYVSVGDFSEGLAPLQKFDYDNWEYRDKNNNYVFSHSYKRVWPFTEGLACVEDESGKRGFIDRIGEPVIPCIYCDSWDFSDGLAAVKDFNGYWGYIDKTGNVIIPFIYMEAWPFTEGLACVKDVPCRYSFIDTTGKVKIPCISSEVGFFQDGLAVIKDTEPFFKKGVIDQKGNIVIPCVYEEINMY